MPSRRARRVVPRADRAERAAPAALVSGDGVRRGRVSAGKALFREQRCSPAPPPGVRPGVPGASPRATATARSAIRTTAWSGARRCACRRAAGIGGVRHPASAPRERPRPRMGRRRRACPNCLANATGARADAGRATRAALAFKVRCVSVTTQRSLAVAKAMPEEPARAVDGLADRYGERAPLSAAWAATSGVAEWVAEADRAARARLEREVFDEPRPSGTSRGGRGDAPRAGRPWSSRHALDAAAHGRTPPRSSGARNCAPPSRARGRDASRKRSRRERARRRRARARGCTLRSPSGRRPRRTWTPVA